MNNKIQAILLKLVLALQKEHWQVAPNWELTLKSEGHAPLTKNIRVQGTLAGESWGDDIEAMIDLKLVSTDEITYFPEYTTYAHMYLKGIESKDIAIKLDIDVAFTNQDLSNQSKIDLAAKKISRFTEDHIENEYSDYVDQNSQALLDYSAGEGKADYDPER